MQSEDSHGLIYILGDVYLQGSGVGSKHFNESRYSYRAINQMGFDPPIGLPWFHCLPARLTDCWIQVIARISYASRPGLSGDPNYVYTCHPSLAN